ncbi:hypothetical protein RN001_005088 [Aquatica leii]|uniref:Uncharacterized protein n=1 Tax=Aquatica leii TaxID=1421715 RepID=A0AAN7PC49_9COLE|nr:hypothetical protein RN001_005088 [Aquatica leii]
MPFTSKKYVDDLDNLTENQLNSLAHELSLIGGDSVQTLTKTLIYRILTNKLGLTYSEIILMAVRLNLKTKSASVPTE